MVRNLQGTQNGQPHPFMGSEGGPQRRRIGLPVRIELPGDLIEVRLSLKHPDIQRAV
jgi:hypothetical protein